MPRGEAARFSDWGCTHIAQRCDVHTTNRAILRRDVTTQTEKPGEVGHGGVTEFARHVM